MTEDSESQSVSDICDDVSTPVATAKCSSCHQDTVKFKCKRCHTQSYCSKKCQKKCWSEHKVWCDSIVELESRVKNKAFADVNFMSKSCLSPKEEIKLLSKFRLIMN